MYVKLKTLSNTPYDKWDFFYAFPIDLSAFNEPICKQQCFQIFKDVLCVCLCVCFCLVKGGQRGGQPFVHFRKLLEG